MVFTSHIFVFYFLPATLLLYYLIPAGRLGLRNLYLLIASYIFYGWWNPSFTLLMAFATIVNYWCGRAIAAAPLDSPRRHAGLLTSVMVSLGTLAFFKYFVFFQTNLNAVVAAFGAQPFPVWRILLPAGISFFIFQSLSYSIDVYRGHSPPVRRFTDFACFVALFPQLIAGPIVRYNTVAGQLVDRLHTRDRFASGVALFMLGFAKKILLANPIGDAADAAFGAESPGAVDAWFGVIAYAFQIYFDFSGYSDMAVGLGRMLGFEFLRNFNAPYRADSITEFWRRWHISLSTFLRDYLYIPLGGNREGPRRTYVNLTVVMLLGGLWHGANWTYVAWGAFHGLLLAWERWMDKESIYAALPRPLRVGATFLLVLFSWVLFRSTDIASAGRYFAAMFGLGGSPGLLSAFLYTPENVFITAVCAFLAFQKRQAFDWIEALTATRVIALLALFTWALATMWVQTFNPFLYFQF